MSIELKQAAQQAIDAFEAFGEADDFATLFTLTQKMNALHTAIQQAEAKTGEPVQADSSEYLRVIASLGAALRRLSFAAQTTGGTAGPDAELQSAIRQAEQALSLGGIGQAMFATGEPVGQVSDLFPSVRNKLHAKGFDSDAPLYTHPAPSVPATGEPMTNAGVDAMRSALEWIAGVHAMGYEYQHVAKEALSASAAQAKKETP